MQDEFTVILYSGSLAGPFNIEYHSPFMVLHGYIPKSEYARILGAEALGKPDTKVEINTDLRRDERFNGMNLTEKFLQANRNAKPKIEASGGRRGG